MGYLNSVLTPSTQVHADDPPVSGGGLRLLNSPNYQFLFFWFGSGVSPIGIFFYGLSYIPFVAFSFMGTYVYVLFHLLF